MTNLVFPRKLGNFLIWICGFNYHISFIHLSFKYLSIIVKKNMAAIMMTLKIGFYKYLGNQTTKFKKIWHIRHMTNVLEDYVIIFCKLKYHREYIFFVICLNYSFPHRLHKVQICQQSSYKFFNIYKT